MRHPNKTARFFHLTGCLVSPHTRLERTAEYRALLGTLAAGLTAHPVRLLSYCLLPDSWHLVVGRTNPRVLNELLRRVGSTPNRVRWNRRGETPLPVIVKPLHTGAQLMAHCIAVERRPVAVGLVRRAQDWPWCSPSERFRLLSRVPLVSAPVLASQVWLDHLNAPRPSDALSLAGRCHLAKWPGLFAGRAKRPDHRVGVSRCAHENQAHPHVERTEHFRLRHPPCPLQPGEDRRNRPALSIERKSQPVGQCSGKILGDAASGDVRHSLDSPISEQRGHSA